MTDATQDLFAEALERLLKQHAQAAEGVWPAGLWDALDEMELPRASLDEALGGGDVALADLFGVIGLVGRETVAVPLVESLVAGRLANVAGMPLPRGITTVGAGSSLRLARSGTAWRLSGAIPNVPWGRQAQVVVAAAVADGIDYLVAVAPGEVVEGINYAGEPRDSLAFVDLVIDLSQVAPLPAAADRVSQHMACARAVQMAGAIATVQAICIDYVKARVQFGKALAQFQAIQQSVAQLAEHAEAASVAASCGWSALGGPHEALWAALAKTRLGDAATLTAAIAHQVHGAIGFTREYRLQLFTRRLWSWREEFGNERIWGAAAGRALAAAPRGGWAVLADL